MNNMNIYHQPTLFDNPFPTVALTKPPKSTAGINQPLANKIDSFYSRDVQEKRTSQKERVFIAIQLLQPCSDYQISEFTEIPRHLVPDRRGKLIEENRVGISHSAVCPHTQKTVTYYKINGDL